MLLNTRTFRLMCNFKLATFTSYIVSWYIRCASSAVLLIWFLKRFSDNSKKLSYIESRLVTLTAYEIEGYIEHCCIE